MRQGKMKQGNGKHHAAYVSRSLLWAFALFRAQFCWKLSEKLWCGFRIILQRMGWFGAFIKSNFPKLEGWGREHSHGFWVSPAGNPGKLPECWKLLQAKRRADLRGEAISTPETSTMAIFREVQKRRCRYQHAGYRGDGGRKGINIF